MSERTLPLLLVSAMILVLVLIFIYTDNENDISVLLYPGYKSSYHGNEVLNIFYLYIKLVVSKPSK